MKKLFLLLFLAFCGISSYTAFGQDANLKHILADWDAETKAAKFKDGKNQFEIVHVSFSSDESETPESKLTSHHEDFIISVRDKEGNAKMTHYFYWMSGGKGKLKIHIVKSEGGIEAGKEFIIAYRYDAKNEKLFITGADHREYTYIAVGGKH